MRPDDRSLEICCGLGAAAPLVCEQPRGGSILALDRAGTMIARATRRNAAAVEAGMAAVRTAALHEANLGGRRFDTIFAIHVGVFLRGDPARELAIIREHLAPDGRFVLPYQPLDPTSVEAEAARYAMALEPNNVVVTQRHFASLVGGRAGCLVEILRVWHQPGTFVHDFYYPYKSNVRLLNSNCYFSCTSGEIGDPLPHQSRARYCGFRPNHRLDFAASPSSDALV